MPYYTFQVLLGRLLWDFTAISLKDDSLLDAEIFCIPEFIAFRTCRCATIIKLVGPNFAGLSEYRVVDIDAPLGSF
jgi:hypothetical protein